MHKGSKEISCVLGATIIIRSSGPFCAYGIEGKKRSLILGPVSANSRVLRYKLPADIDKVYIKTEKSTEWTLDWSSFTRSESLDITPVELPIGYQKPESLAEQMRRFIKTEVSNQAAQDNLGTFTEEDDFELDEEILTPYELTDMEETEEPWDETYDQSPISSTAKNGDPSEALIPDPQDAEKSEAKKAVDNEA